MAQQQTSAKLSGTSSISASLQGADEWLKRLDEAVAALETLADRVHGPSPRPVQEHAGSEDKLPFSMITAINGRVSRLAEAVRRIEGVVQDLEASLGDIP